MSDDLRIPALGGGPAAVGPASVRLSPSYRARRGSQQAGTGLIRLAVAGVVGLAMIGTIGWAVVNRRPATIPVIEADSRPLRVKPDNPGGMQVAGADELLLGDGVEGRDRMAPAAEAPAPQALRAQMQQAAPAAVPAATQAVTSAATPPVATQAATQAAAPGTVKPAATPATPTPAAPATLAVNAPRTPAPTAPALPVPAAPSRPVAASLAVQLGALPSEAAAQAEWQRLSRNVPDALGGRQPSYQRTEHDGRVFWRLRTGGFADVADATGFCVKLKAKGANCTIASF